MVEVARPRSGNGQAAHTAGVREGAARTIAQTACLVLGATLIAAGILGFFFGGSSFGAGSNVQGQNFIVFEVNGWHNVVHIVTGALLLFASPRAALSVTALLVFAGGYVIVTIWGFVDGNDVINLVAINAADNWLHVFLTLVSAAAALLAGGLGASSLAARRRAGDKLT